MQKYVIGIDVGGSATKIVAFDFDGNLIKPLFVRANDQVTSIYGAFGKFTSENGISLDSIERVMITGVGSSYVTSPIFGLNCINVPEFECIGRGGLYLSSLESAIIMSMGTGTALVHADKNGTVSYLGGTGVGGGTLMGLSKQLLKMDNIDHIVELAEAGDLGNVDLRIKDMANRDSFNGLPEFMTSSNFGKVSDIASKSDIALGIINMVFEVEGMLGVFAARQHKINEVVLTGNLTSVKQCPEIFGRLKELFGINFIIPENSQFATAIGAALMK